MSTYTLQKYVKKIKRLNRSRGTAPHKPLLLLSVIELIERGQIHENKIYCSIDLENTLKKYWTTGPDWKFNIAMPFSRLKNDKFWHLHANVGYEEELRNTKRIDSTFRLRKLIAYASLNEALFFLLTNPQHRGVIRQTIIDHYFPDLKNEIKDLIFQQRQVTEQQVRDYEQSLIGKADRPFTPLEPVVSTQLDTPARSGCFRRSIMKLYDYTCAVCRLRVVTKGGESATDAAHIIPFSESYNDDVRNGISLCKLHHWAFDTGLIYLNESYRVVVPQLTVEQEPMDWLTEFQGERIRLPEHRKFFPAQYALTRHREGVLRQQLLI